MKNRRKQLVASKNTSTRFSCQQKRTRTTTTIAVAGFYLPDECWEHVFTFLNNGDDGRYLNSLSVVSKQFLSITNRLLSSLCIIKRTDSFIHSLFCRFTNLTSLNLSLYQGNLDAVLCQIARFPYKLTSLNLSYKPTFPAKGLRAFSKRITTLTSITCSKVGCFKSTDMFLIAECFPLLEELDLGHPLEELLLQCHRSFCNFPYGVKTLTLFNLTKINLSDHYYINDTSLFNLFKNCKLLEEVIMFKCDRITKAGILSALFERPTLRSLSFTNYFEPKNFAMLYELVRNYPSLSEIKMEYTFDEEDSIEDSNSSMDFVVRPQLKSLGLSYNSWLGDENIRIFSSIFPNLQRLDLNQCKNISEEGIFHVLKGCCNIRHLNLAKCVKVERIGLNFEVSKLEVLNLSYTSVDDETLYMISKNCCGLLHLLLKGCCYVTKKGVKHVVENCTQLIEINLRDCYKVHANIIDNMVISRPSLRKIRAPPGFDLSYEKRELFSRYGCLVY